ncbi:MAG: MarC family protein [Deltaproteobacteria bacterium]|nr:MarC family protein [Deltaproteobacteria bacterium]MBW1794311.1 MarC family protein [Deltaproteobacteria bacterium]MBW2329434.1 MarC family protein [Deltaproteobacteria bacterium]
MAVLWDRPSGLPIGGRFHLFCVCLTDAAIDSWRAEDYVIVYLVFHFAEWIIRVMGVGGIRVVTRLMGLLLAVIAVQFMVSGFQQIR